ncbi:hypothetical protein [Streptomyces sp. NPDC048636]|uniref:hypothetical protein n=1 Tax=Streptomyces sp. NPDC048636 TaxID=3155762 RepID=UPI00341D3FA9
MRFFDKLTGTMRPSSDVEPQSAGLVKIALLGLNKPDSPWVVRDGAPEGVNLVAEWRIMEPAWQTFFVKSQLSRALQIRMRLIPKDHVVRALDLETEVKWVNGTPVSLTYRRGSVTQTSVQWELGRGADGRIERTEVFRFDSSSLKDPLRNTVLKAGWTWRGVPYSKL